LTPDGGCYAGVSVAVIADGPAFMVPTILTEVTRPQAAAGRIAAVAIAFGRGRFLMLVSVYLYTGELVRSLSNTYLLDYVAALCRALGGPFLVSGDWQSEPDAVAEADCPAFFGADMHAPEGHACSSGATLDLFLVDSRLRPAVTTKAAAWPWLPRAHRLVRIDIEMNCQLEELPVLVWPRPFPVCRPYGPLREPPEDGGDVGAAVASLTA
jgi:hypothetical protein